MKNKFFSRKLALFLSVTLLMTTLFVGMPSKAVDLQNDDNLIAYYSFDDINGTTVPDKSGNGHNGTVSGAELTVGKVGTAISFGKAGDGVTVPHSEDLNFAETDSYTISFWVKPEELSAWQCVIAKNRTISPAREYMGFWFDSHYFAYCQGTDGSAWFDSPQYSGAENGIWYNVVMVQDASQNKSMMYLNGEQVIQKNYTKASSGSGTLQMGSYNGKGGEQFYGSLDEVKIYSTALSATEIKTNYNNDLLKDAAIAYWSFDDISGTTVTDLSGNGHNGTINGAETTVGKLGSAISFDVSGDHVKVPHSDKLNFSENDSYTISFWVKPEELSAWQCVIAKNRTISPAREYMGFWFDGNRFAYCQGTDGSAWFDNPRYAGAENGIWYNVVMVQDASQNKSMMYLNGELVVSKDYTKAWSGTAELFMGNQSGTGTEQFYGALDEVKILGRAMGSAEIKLAYESVAETELEFYYSFDDVTDTTVPDNSVAGNDGTIVGSPDVKGNGKVGNSMFITDDGDGFIVPHKDSFNFSATDSYTLTAWIKADSFGGWRSIAAKNRDDSGLQYYGLFLNSNNLTFAMGVRTVDEVKTWPAISTKIEAGEWYHVVLVQDGEAGKSYMYLDGALVGTHDATYDYSGSAPWEIGGRFTAAKEYFKGGIDELKLYNIALEAEEIESEYKDQQAANPDFAEYTGAWPTLEENEVPNVIFDSDLGGDCDDLGALAILYYYHQNGEINLVATTSCTSMWGAGGMSAVNTYYGCPDMPMGFNGTKYSAHSSSAYGRYLSTHFSNPLVDKQEYESAVKVMRKALSEAEDNSITICAVGPYTNLYNLLCSTADEYSPLSGYDLVKQKVKWLLAMGCQYPSGKESNIANNVTAAKYINQNWPTPIVYSTWEIGNPIMTASRETLDRMDANNPIREGYEEHFRNLKYGIPRPSWDPLTAYFTGAGYDEYYDLHRADVAIDSVGNSVFFDNETTGARAYLTKKDNVTNEQMAVVLDDLMVAAKGRIENGLYCDYFDDTDGRLVKNSTNATTETVTHTFIGNEWYDTYYKSEDVGASIEVTFEGTSFTLYGGYLPTGGIVDIYLDGKLINSVDTYKSSNYSSSHLYHKDGLSKSTHTLKLVTSDKKNSASSGNSFLFDFIKVDTFEVTLGDVNGDGVIDVCDLVGVQNIIDGKAPSCSAADINSDGKIDSLDTAEIRKVIISK